MRKLKSALAYFFVALTLIFSACSDDDDNVTPVIATEGFFVVNEGGFGNGNTSLSYYDRETETVANEIFANANGIPLGDQSQSMTVFNGMGYIVVQNSAKIEVIDAETYTSVATIREDLPSPRYFVGLNAQKGYVSDWGDGFTGTVKVINLSTYEVTKTISTGSGANRMELVGDKLWVANSGGFGRDNTISIINTATDEVENTITVGDNPNSIEVDSDGNVWVTTSGHTTFDFNTFEVIEAESTPAAIVKLSASGDELLKLEYDEVGFPQSADNLTINTDGNRIYYLYSGQIYTMSTDATALPTSPFATKSYYGLSVDPFDGTIIGFEAPSFSSSGNMDFYDAQGELIDTFVVGIGPNGAAF